MEQEPQPRPSTSTMLITTDLCQYERSVDVSRKIWVTFCLQGDRKLSFSPFSLPAFYGPRGRETSERQGSG